MRVAIKMPRRLQLLSWVVLGVLLLCTLASHGHNTRGGKKSGTGAGAGPNNSNIHKGAVDTAAALSMSNDLPLDAISSLLPISSDDHIVTNIALNKTIRMSSSASADVNYGRFAVDGDEETFVESALEKNAPYLVVDLQHESYIDEVTIISPKDLGDIVVFAVDQKTLAFSRNTSDLMDRGVWHSAAHAGTHVTLHAHTSARYIRVQLQTSGRRLLISELIVRGVRLNPREMAYSQCLSGHDGSEVCSSRGICSRGRCSCGAFYYGSRCEYVRLSVFTTCSSFLIVAIALFCVLRSSRIRFKRSRSLNLVKKKLDVGDGKLFPHDDAEKWHFARSTSEDIESIRNRNLTPSTFPVQRWTSDEALPLTLPPQNKLHVLFASPLVLLTPTNVLPVAPLDVEREIELLTRSLAQGGARNRIKLEVTCATIDALQSVLTLREATVLHISSHCQPDLIALEDTNSAAHLVSADALGSLLAATKPALNSSRLVVLNCCHSEGIGRAFVRAGFAHVVALSEELRVRDVTAATFTRAFYLALASGHTVGAAFRLAREAVALCPTSQAWEADAFVLLPETVSHDEIIWSREATSPLAGHSLSPPPFANPCQIPGSCEDFVGRSQELWTILQMLQRHRVINVYGRSGSGKTALITQLAHHVRLRRSESWFADGVFFIQLEPAAMKLAGGDEVTNEVLCGQIADTLSHFSSLGYSSQNGTTSPNGGEAKPLNLYRRSVSKVNRDAQLAKFASQYPNSLVVLDGLPPSLLESRCFQETLSYLLRQSSKLQVITASEARFETPVLKVYNVVCGPLTDMDTARLLIRLCHPKLAAPAVSTADGQLAKMRTGSNAIASSALEGYDEEFEETARALSRCLVIRSLVGHPASIRKLAVAVNARCGVGEVFTFTDDLDIF